MENYSYKAQKRIQQKV